MALARPPGAAARAGASTTCPTRGTGRTCPARAPSVGVAACRGASGLASTLFCRAAGAGVAALGCPRMAMGLPVSRRVARLRSAGPAPSRSLGGPSGTKGRRVGAGVAAAVVGASITSRIGTSRGTGTSAATACTAAVGRRTPCTRSCRPASPTSSRRPSTRTSGSS